MRAAAGEKGPLLPALRREAAAAAPRCSALPFAAQQRTAALHSLDDVDVAGAAAAVALETVLE